MNVILVLVISLFFLNSCGVKGKPLPPKTPREIGIDKPIYKGVDNELTKPKTKNEDKK